MVPIAYGIFETAYEASWPRLSYGRLPKKNGLLSMAGSLWQAERTKPSNLGWLQRMLKKQEVSDSLADEQPTSGLLQVSLPLVVLVTASDL